MNVARFFSWIFFLLLSQTLFSQIDREFWFVGPEASANHGDRPVYFRISTMDDPANITLRMPANLSFTPVKSLIPANTTFSIRLDNIDGNSSWLDSIENRPPGVVLNKGLLLTSDAYITAYYEINNASNPAIFPLKGKNAVGLEFFIPGQTDYANQTNDGSEAFDIVATRDTTVVTITPAIDLVDHPANVSFQVILNKGETYSARTLNTTAGASLAGSHVVADKPIAITISDDSIITGGWDIIGDQIIPVNLLGWEYIAIKGYADNSPPSNNDERVYVTAVSDNTEVRIDGNPVPAATLNAGEQYDHAIPPGNNTVYIRTTKPVYVYQLTGHPGEAGASVLPQDSCTGSRKVGFNRSNTNAFAMMILTRSGNENSFFLNGNGTIIAGTSFQTVPGTGGNWVYYRQNNMTLANVPIGANLLENTSGKFHLGILNNVGASSEYGYFSDFSTLYLGSDASMCPGDSLVLDGGPFRTSYEWKRLEGGIWTTVGTSQTFACYDTGSYACITNGDFCTLMDTIQISFYPNASVNLGADRQICEGTLTTFSPGIYQSYNWSNGSPAPSYTTGNEGKVWVTVMNNDGCVASDTVMVFVDSIPLGNHPVIGPDTVCQGSSNVVYHVDSLAYASSYLWTLPAGSLGSGTRDSILVSFTGTAVSGSVTVRGVNQCGIGPLVVHPVQVNPLPANAGGITSPDTVCQGQTGFVISVPPVAHATAYAWSFPPGIVVISGGSTNSATVSANTMALSDTIFVYGENLCGSGGSSYKPLTVSPLPMPAGAVTGLPVVCQGQTGVSYSIAPIAGSDSCIWTLPPGATIISGAGSPSVVVNFDSSAISGNIAVRGYSFRCGSGQGSVFPVTVNPLPLPAGAISGPAEVCEGSQGKLYRIQSLANATGYNWTVPAGALITSGSGTSQITVSFGLNAQSGLISVQGFNVQCGNGRANAKSITINPLPLATGNITGPTPVCQGDSDRTYTISIIDPRTTTWHWQISPPNAGTIAGNGAAVHVSWSDGFFGNASLRVNGINGCGAGPISADFPVIVNYHHEVWLESCFDPATTKNSMPLLLRGGHPAGAGGSFSGPGVYESNDGNWYFDPRNNMVGSSVNGSPQTITYIYTNSFGCRNQASQIIRVYPSNADQNCPGILYDVRDGKTYPTFSSGSGLAFRCWMGANLDYGKSIDWHKSQTDNCVAEKYCSWNFAVNCSQYGGYYQWDELMGYTTATGDQGVCPPGWHVPTNQDWELLIQAYPGKGIAGTPLKDTNAVNGFQASLNGVLFMNHQWYFTAAPVSGSLFWSSTQWADKPLSYGLNSKNPSISEYHSGRHNAFPVRCVRNVP